MKEKKGIEDKRLSITRDYTFLLPMLTILLQKSSL